MYSWLRRLPSLKHLSQGFIVKKNKKFAEGFFFRELTTAKMDKPKLLTQPKSNGPAKTDRLHGFIAWAAEFCSAVLIILCNKTLMQTMAFRFPVTLTALHFACTAVGARACVTLGRQVTIGAAPSTADCDQELQCLQKPGKTVDMSARSHSSDISDCAHFASHTPITTIELACFAFISSIAIVLSNVSLCTNSVAFYQVMKLPVLVFIATLEAALGVKKYTHWQSGGIALILSGTAVTIRGNVTTSALGLTVALGSIVSTGMHQLLCGRLQAWHGLSSSELLAKVSPIKAVILALAGPLLDRALLNSDLRTVDWTSELGLVIGASCSLAVVLNLSQYTVIRHLGAGLYQALSQLKTIFIVVLGSLLFDATLNLWQLVGVGVAVSGVSLLLKS